MPIFCIFVRTISYFNLFCVHMVVFYKCFISWLWLADACYSWAFLNCTSAHWGGVSVTLLYNRMLWTPQYPRAVLRGGDMPSPVRGRAPQMKFLVSAFGQMGWKIMLVLLHITDKIFPVTFGDPWSPKLQVLEPPLPLLVVHCTAISVCVCRLSCLKNYMFGLCTSSMPTE